MPTDLTERLAAKLEGLASVDDYDCLSVGVSDLPIILPLLLSEPELVAGLPEAVRLSVLTERERAVMKLGEAGIALDDASADYIASGADESGPEWHNVRGAGREYNAALAEARALTPEGKE